MAFEIKGLKELQNKLDTLDKNVKALDGQIVPITEILPPSVVACSSRFASAQELFDSSGFSQEDINAIPEDKLDEFISKNTSYPNWATMRDAATKLWVEGKLAI